jgi:alpha-L-fucosidase
MTMPTWWTERRFGLFIHANAATVPAWAPIGEYSEWYRSHLGEDVADVVLHPHTMVEVLAHHRERWGHVESYDDFVPLLTFKDFDAEAWARLTRDAGAGYSVLVTKHHDGWAWWDAPNTGRTLTEHGPNLNVVAEYAAACERNDIAFGTYYSLLDWGDDRYPTKEYVDEVLHPQVLDLVQRHGSVMLWGDGHWGHDAGTWKTADLMNAVRALSPNIVMNDRWWASSSDVPDGAPDIVRTFEYDPPDDITPGPWELTRGIGHSFGYNRAERAEHHLTGFEIVDLFTEVVAKGGNLLLNVGPAADGTIPELQAGPLRDAGTWIRRHCNLFARVTPWSIWGDTGVRYFADGDDLIAVDIDSTGTFGDLTNTLHDVSMVSLVADGQSEALPFEHHADGLHIQATIGNTDDHIGIAVYRICLAPTEQPGELFSHIDPEPTPLAPLLDGASPGDIVQLGDGVYEGPAVVPPGVILRGLGPGRTTISPPQQRFPSIASEGPVLAISRNARVEHLQITGNSTRSDWFAKPLVEMTEGFGSILGCKIAGSLHVDGDDALIRAVKAQGLIAVNADRLHVSRCHFVGNRWDVGVELRGGGGQHIESNEFSNHLCAIRLLETTGSTVRGNTIRGRWWGVHAAHAEGAHIHGNRILTTMRAVDIDGGTQAVVDGNSVIDGDSGCIVEDGATDCEVYGNHWDRCRIGLLEWSAVGLRHQDNVASSLHEPDSAFISGP